MAVSGPNTRLWVGLTILGFGALLIGWINSIYAAPGSAQATLLAFELFWAVLIALTGAILVASGLSRQIIRKREIQDELRAEFATPLVDPGLTYMYQRKPPPPT